MTHDFYASNCLESKIPDFNKINFHKTIKNVLKEQGLKCGLSFSFFCGPSCSIDLCVGNKVISENDKHQPMSPSTFLQCASLSKTVAAAFAIEYFEKASLTMDHSVNSILEKTSSPFRVKMEDNNSEFSADDLQLRHLVDHTGLGMHYVFGFPKNEKFPSVEDLLLDKHSDKGYQGILTLKKKPGSIFSYSGGGFIVLQHVLESLEKKGIDEIFQPFLKKMGMSEFMFSPEKIRSNENCAFGYSDDNTAVGKKGEGMLLFPPLAAGGLCTPRALCTFWQKVVHSFHSFENCHDSISNKSAKLMLDNSHDKGSGTFMNATMGLGVFVLKAGSNRIACHQAANDGFRGVYLVCFDGPDAGKGVVAMSNGDNKSVLVICKALQIFLLEAQWHGVNLDYLKNNLSFNWEGIPQEQIVNLAYKNLVFDAFEN